jgi:SsrA-binding protein
MEIANRKATHDYEILERLEAGIALIGCEVKSLRAGKANLKNSYAMVKGEELWLIGCHIDPYAQGSYQNADPERSRKLLMKRNEINKLMGRIQEKGLTLIPLKLYLKGHLVKIQLGLARAKKLYDKREDIKTRESDRAVRQAMLRRR